MSHLCGDDIVLWPRWPGKLLHRSRAKSGRLAKLARWAVPFIFLCAVPEIGLAAAIDCSPVKPSNGTDTNIEDNFKGHAQVILKSLGSGEIENGFKQNSS